MSARTTRLGLTSVLAVLTVLALALSVPRSLREAYDRGGFYLFSWEFLGDIPRRLTGPGRFRFLLQPLVATLVGIGAGRSDARAGRAPYLNALLRGAAGRGELVRDALRDITHLLLAGVLADLVFQWVIFGVAYPGAALVVGPVLITAPYGLARALANRISRVADGPR